LQIRKLQFLQQGAKVKISFVDKSTMTISVDAVVEFGLHEGLELDDQQYARLQTFLLYSKCNTKLYTLLAGRAHSIKEMRRKLSSGNKFSPELVAVIINKAINQGLLDDEQFTRQFIEDSRQYRNEGDGKIAQRLYMKGVDRQLIKELLRESTPDRETQFLQVKELALKKWGTYQASLELQKKKARLYRFLVSRGFSLDVVGQVVFEISRMRGDY
jgi:regulatory protein